MSPVPRFNAFALAVFTVTTCVVERAAWAQSTRSFVTLELDAVAIDKEAWYPIVGLGATRDFGAARLSVGGQGDLAVWPGVGIATRPPSS